MGGGIPCTFADLKMERTRDRTTSRTSDQQGNSTSVLQPQEQSSAATQMKLEAGSFPELLDRSPGSLPLDFGLIRP